MLAEFFLDPHHLVAGCLGRHDEGGNTLFAGIGIGDREHDHHMAIPARGDELLGARNDIVVAIAPRPGAQVGGVGSGLRLRQREAADPLAARHFRAGTDPSAHRYRI